MTELNLLCEGKSKKVYQAGDPDQVILYYKDDTTAFGGVKKARIVGKGALSCKITAILYDRLRLRGIPTHYVRTLSEREQLCKKVRPFPLEIIVRNVLAGTASRRLGVREGTTIPNTVYEICYKNDHLRDPLINEDHAVSLGLATYKELEEIKNLALAINAVLVPLFESVNISLIDFKAEFGKDKDNNIILADEISPDTARFWDMTTHEKLDKDRFRQDLGNVLKAYQEILSRLERLP